MNQEWFKNTEDYKSMTRVHQLWCNLSIAMNNVKEGESIIKKRNTLPIESNDSAVIEAWSNLTSPENLEDLKEWCDPSKRGPYSNRFVCKLQDLALQICEKRAKNNF